MCGWWGLCLDTRGEHDSELPALHKGSIFAVLNTDSVDTWKRNTDNNQISLLVRDNFWHILKVVYSAKPHLNLESPCLKSACNLEPADPHCAQTSQSVCVYDPLTSRGRDSSSLCLGNIRQCRVQDEGWRESQASQTASHLQWAMSRCHIPNRPICDIKWQLREQQPMVSQKLSQCPV